MDKNSFLIYLDYEEQFNLLTDEQIGQLMRAIIKYEKTKEIPQLDGMLKMAFSFIKTQLDRDREKYQAKCEQNRENAKRGGRPKRSKRFRKNRTVLKKTERKPKNPIMIMKKIMIMRKIYLKKKKIKKEKLSKMCLLKIRYQMN